ncbi:hypothetical protein [Edaphobacter sp. 12200R-103]|jgi:hypothetical protein|uniref:hypothetical protein n=1 Tax=Edaphobacter sp. 12200R-103 TaxID=2703788 RepID=UPI00138C9599|nr:hypothetical protein [Edaphobacter sp. 12200R-103]QHS53304.1 hypothetical protein GWR55_17465 [Edaphobacter sp. 12200R-103]
MTQEAFISTLSYLEPILCAMVLSFLLRSKEVRNYIYLVSLLCVKIMSSAICLPVLYLAGGGRQVIEKHLAYQIYFYAYWLSYALEAILSLLVIYSIFKLAMAPLRGLQTLGILIFRWVAVISVAVAMGVAFSPHITGIKFMVSMITQLQQTSSILTLCLLLFVCFAIRPMGLSHGSRIFGVSFGLGFLATINLVDSAWLSHSSDMSSMINIINGIAICLTLTIWSAYFAFPEPKRRLIVLPTTSPFLRWNQISLALGDEPGYVAVGGISPEIFAPAELEVMRRASTKMTHVAPTEISSASAAASSPLMHSIPA